MEQKSFFRKYGILCLIILFCILPTVVNQGFIGLRQINSLYRIFFTVGIFYLGAVLYRYFIGKVIVFLLFLLLTLNFFASLVARYVYDSKFDGTQAVSVIQTNTIEGIGMMKTYGFYIALGVLFFGFGIYLVKVLSKRIRIQRKSKAVVYFLIANVLLFVGLTLDGFVLRESRSNFNYYGAEIKYFKKMPVFNVASFYEAFGFMREAKGVVGIEVDYSDLKYKENNLKNIVLILGESAQKDAFSLYGNTTKTTPNIEKRLDNLLVYDQAVAPASYTVLAVPLMLSKALPSEEYDPQMVADNIISLTNSLGDWDTHWYSTQDKVSLYVSTISAMANQAKFSQWETNEPDGSLVPMLKSAIENERKNLVVLHTYGSHIPLKKRYTSEFGVFKDHKEYINEYYNTILYTDNVIEQVIQAVENTPSIVIYVSDHGQRDNGKKFVHSLTQKGLDVPFIIWHSDEVDEQYKITDRVATPISTTNLYEIIKNYLGIIDSQQKDSNDDLKVLGGDLKLFYYNNLPEGN